MWDVSRQQGPAEFEQEAAKALAAWRAGRFELPDYYLVLATDTGAAGAGDHGPDFHLGPLRSARPHRVAVVVAAEPAQQAAGVLQALGSLRHGPWWPALRRGDRDGPNLLPGQPGRRQCRPGGPAAPIILTRSKVTLAS